MITSSRCAGLLRPSWAPNYGNFTGPLGSFSGGFLFPGAIKLDPNFDDAGEQQLFALSLAAVANLPAFSEARDNSYPLPPSLRGWRIWTSAAVALLLVLAGIATWWLRGDTAGYRSPSPAKTPETVRAAVAPRLAEKICALSLSLEHLVGAAKERERHGETERPGGLEV